MDKQTNVSKSNNPRNPKPDTKNPTVNKLKMISDTLTLAVTIITTTGTLLRKIGLNRNSYAKEFASLQYEKPLGMLSNRYIKDENKVSSTAIGVDGFYRSRNSGQLYAISDFNIYIIK